jgi:hypothetical protein
MNMKIDKIPTSRAEKNLEKTAPNYDIDKFKEFDNRIMAEDLETEEEKILRQKFEYIGIKAKEADSKDRAIFLLEQLKESAGYGEITDIIISVRERLEKKLVELSEDISELKEFYEKFRSGSRARYSALEKIIELSDDFEEIWSIASRQADSSSIESAKVKDLALKKILSLKDLTKEQLATAELLSFPGGEIDIEIRKRLNSDRES